MAWHAKVRAQAVNNISSTRRYVRSFLPVDGIQRRFAHGVAWSLVGGALAQGGPLVASILLARLIGAVGFGEYGIIQSTISLFGVLAGLGLGLTATRYIAELTSTDPERVGKIISLSLWAGCSSSALCAGILYAVAPYLADHVLNAPHLLSCMRFASGLLFANCIVGIQAGILQGLEAFRTAAAAASLRGLLAVPLIPLSAFWWGLPGVMAALIVTTAASAAYSQVAIVRHCRGAGIPIPLTGGASESGLLWHFAFPVLLSSLSVVPMTWFAQALLVRQRSGYSEMGIFNAASQWRSAVAFLPTLMSQPVLPLLANLYGRHDHGQYISLLGTNVKITLLTAVAVAAPFCLVSRWIMAMYGPGFSQKWAVLVLLSLASVLNAYSAALGQAIQSTGRAWTSLSLNAIWGLSFLACSLWLVPRYAALGLAAGFLVSYMVHSLSSTIYVALRLLPDPGRSSAPCRAAGQRPNHRKQPAVPSTTAYASRHT